jgi:hypothetical protein
LSYNDVHNSIQKAALKIKEEFGMSLLPYWPLESYRQLQNNLCQSTLALALAPYATTTLIRRAHPLHRHRRRRLHPRPHPPHLSQDLGGRGKEEEYPDSGGWVDFVRGYGWGEYIIAR